MGFSSITFFDSELELVIGGSENQGAGNDSFSTVYFPKDVNLHDPDAFSDYMRDLDYFYVSFFERLGWKSGKLTIENEIELE